MYSVNIWSKEFEIKKKILVTKLLPWSVMCEMLIM